jgi:hypothetical protein
VRPLEMGDDSLFGDMGMELFSLPALPALPSEKLKPELTEAELYLQMAKDVTLKSLLRPDCELPADENKLVDLWSVTEVEEFFLNRVAEQFPCVYRVALKFLPRAVATCFQERVFSTGKNVMPLNATNLGHRLFKAMVRLRHNDELVQQWTGAQNLEVIAKYDATSKEDDELAETLASVAKLTHVNVFHRRATVKGRKGHRRGRQAAGSEGGRHEAGKRRRK